MRNISIGEDLTPSRYKVMGNKGEEFMTQRPEPRTGHPYYMYEMIHGQPDSITRILNEEGDAVKALADRIGSAERVHKNHALVNAGHKRSHRG